MYCDGSEVSKTAYSDLYEVIKDQFGTPADPTKFKLPKINDARYLQGSAIPGQYKSEELPNIKGTYGDWWSNISLGSCTGAIQGIAASYQDEIATGVHGSGQSDVVQAFTLDASKMTGSVYKDGGSVQPKSITVRYLICYKKVIAKVDTMVGFPDYSATWKKLVYIVNDGTSKHAAAGSFTVEENGFIHILNGNKSYSAVDVDGWTVSVNGKILYWNYCTQGNVPENGMMIPVSQGDVVSWTDINVPDEPTASGGGSVSISFAPAKASPAKISELYMGAPDWDNVIVLKSHYTTEPYRFSITTDGWLNTGFYDPDVTIPDNSAKGWGTAVNGKSASWHSVSKYAGAYNTDAQLTMIPVSSGDIVELTLPESGATNDGRYYAVVNFVPRKKIQIDASDITTTGACGVPNYNAYDSAKHDISFDSIVTKSSSGYAHQVSRTGMNCFVATEDCFVFPGCYCSNAANPDAVAIFVGESNSCTFMYRYSVQDIVAGDQVYYTAVPLKKGQIVTVLCNDAASTLSGKIFWLPMQSLAPQIAIPDYTSNGIIYTNYKHFDSPGQFQWTATENCYVNWRCENAGHGYGIIYPNPTTGLSVWQVGRSDNVDGLICGSGGAFVEKGTTCVASIGDVGDIVMVAYKLKSVKQDTSGSMLTVPDWDNSKEVKIPSGTSVTNTWEVPTNGYIRFCCQSTPATAPNDNEISLIVNGISVAYVVGNAYYNPAGLNVVPVAKGDKIYFTSSSSIAVYESYFYPCKSVVQETQAAYVVERKRGTNTDGSAWWYTLWSDKWCEQGGKATIDVIDKNIDPSKSISLKKAMEKDTLSIQLTAATTPATHTPRSMYGFAQSTTAILVIFDHVGGDEIDVPTTVPFFWRADGYVA